MFHRYYQLLVGIYGKLLKRFDISNQTHRLMHGSFWSFLGSLTSRLSAMAAAIVVARILGRTTYGEFGIIQSTIAMFGTIAGFGMGTTAAKFVAEFRQKDPTRAGQIIALSTIISWGAGIVMGLIVIVLAPWIARSSLAAEGLADSVRLGGILLFLNSVNGGQLGVLTGFEAFKSTAKVNLWGALLNFPLIAAGAYFAGVSGSITGMTIAQLVVCLMSSRAVKEETSRYGIHVSYSQWSTESQIIWHFSLPAVLGSVLVTPISWAASSMLARAPAGYAHVGALTAANQWFNALMWFPYVIGAVVLPMLSERHGANDGKGSTKLLRVSIGLSAAATLPVALIACFLSPYIMALYGSDFRSEWPTLAISLFTAVIFAIQLPVGDLIAASSRMWVGFVLNLVWSLVFLTATWLLLERGAAGLATARLLAYVAQAILSFIYASFVIKQVREQDVSAGTAVAPVGAIATPNAGHRAMAAELGTIDLIEDGPESGPWFGPRRNRFTKASAPNGISFTVVIPTYNRSRLVLRAIDSVLNQTFSASQILVIDDGSTDDTAEQCRKYGNSIQYVRQVNGGVSSARNGGIKLAQHAWTAFLDSDDYWAPTHLEKMADAIRSTNGCARFYFADLGLPATNGKTTLWNRIGFEFSAPFLVAPDATDWMLSQREPCSIQCSVFNTEILRHTGGFDRRYKVTEDRELFCRLGIGEAVCAVNSVGCIQTADDNPSNRLTGIIHAKSQGFWEHESLLWTELGARFPNMRPHQRRGLGYSLAVAHWRLCRLHWQAGRFVRSILHIIAAARSQPAFLIWLIRHRHSYGWESSIFPPCRAVVPVSSEVREVVR